MDIKDLKKSPAVRYVIDNVICQKKKTIINNTRIISIFQYIYTFRSQNSNNKRIITKT